MSERREIADKPGLVNVCILCDEKVELDRHIREIGGRYYAVCYDCTE